MTRFAATTWLVLGAAALSQVAQPARAQEPAGVTAAVNPQATGTPPAELPRILEIGADVVQNEHITTGPEGQVQLLFRDGSTMTLGPSGDLTVDNFVYDPQAKTAKLAMTAATGVFRFVGGRASKDEPVVLTTPTATIGIRGGINYTTVGANGDTETWQAFGKDTSATSKSTGEQAKLTKNGFGLAIRNNQPIETRKIDLARLGAMFGSFRGRPGSNGGASSPPNQNSQQAQNLASTNSNLPPGSFLPINFTPYNTLGSITTYTNQLVSYGAQTATTAGSGSLFGPTGGSGSFTSGIVSPLFNSLASSSDGLANGVSPFPAFTLTESGSGFSETITQGSVATTTVSGNVAVGGIVNASFNQTQTIAGNTVINGSSFAFNLINSTTATIQNATVAELGGDSLLAIGRLTGGTGTFTTATTVNGITTITGPFTQTLSPSQSSAFAIGVPATLLPTNGIFNYSLLGATSPVFADGSGALGKFTGSLSIMFGVNPSLVIGSPGITVNGGSSFIVGLDATITIPGDGSYHLVTVGGLSNLNAQITGIQGGNSLGTITGFASQAGAGFSGSAGVTVMGTAKACPSGGGSCGAVILGFLAGPGGTRAAILYTVGNNVLGPGPYNLSQLIIGAAAFKR